MVGIKQAALDERYSLTPERFVNGCPKIKLPPTKVCINPISKQDGEGEDIDRVNFPTLTAAGYVRNWERADSMVFNPDKEVKALEKAA